MQQQLKGKQGAMSTTKEAPNLDGTKTKARPRPRIMAEENTHKILRSSSVSNAEIELDKQSSKIKTAEIARQRSDLGLKKSPLQIKRTRSAAATATSVRDDTNLLKLRKIKSHSAANHTKSLPLQSPLPPTNPVDQQTTKSDDVKTLLPHSEKDLQTNQVKTNADQQIPTPIDVDEEEKVEEEEDEVEKQMDEEVAKTSADIKDIIIIPQEHKPKKSVIEEKKKFHHNNDRSPPITPTLKKVAPAANKHARIHPTPAKLNPISDHENGTSSRLQSLADLIMWRDVSRSAFVFGIGSFAIISSSYTKDLNISFISVISYLGLVYLAVSFIFRSLISRGNVEMDKTCEEYVVGEEEAVWLMKLILPYVNEFLSKLRALFCGDPATSMKLAVVLFVLARCGSAISIWKMTKLGFFGVFLVPKLSSSYSPQLTAYGRFWIERLKDAWESCSHKKAVAFGIFTLLWNLSSVVARIWGLFLLFVGFRYYQHSLLQKQY